MHGTKGSSGESGTVEVVVMLKKEDYESMEELSMKLGMDLHSWVKHVLLSKVKGKEA